MTAKKKLTDEDIEKKAAADWQEAKNGSESRRAAYTRWYQLYRSAQKPKKDKWKSNVFVSLTFSIINTFLPRIVKALLGDGNNWFIIKARKKNKSKDAQKIADIYTQLIQIFIKEMNLYVKFVGAFLYALIFGNCYLKWYWKLVKRKSTVTKKAGEKIKEKDSETGEETERTLEDDEEIEVTRKVVDRPECDVIIPHDGISPTHAKEFNGNTPFYHRTFLTREELINNPLYTKKKLYRDNIAAAKGIPQNSSTDEMRNSIGEVFTPTDKIEVVEQWLHGRVITLADGKIIRNSKPNKGEKNPFVNICNYPEPNAIEGVSEIENFESLQTWVNDATNIRIDNLKLILNGMFTVIRGSHINPIQLRSRPGGVIEVDSHDHIKDKVFPEMKQSAYEEINHIRGLIQVITGISDYTTGNSIDRNLNDTASGIKSIIAEANERFALKINIWRITVMQESLYFLVEMIQQYMTREDIADMLGIDAKDAIEPEDIDFNALYDFEIPAYLSNDDKNIEYQAIRALVAMIKEIPQDPASKIQVDTDELTRRICTIMGKEDLIKDREPVPAQPAAPAAAMPGIAGQQPQPAGGAMPQARQIAAPARPQGPQPAGFTPQMLGMISAALGRKPEVIIEYLKKGGDPKTLALQAHIANMKRKGVNANA